MKYKIKTNLNKEMVIKKISDLLLEENRLAGSVSGEKFKIRKTPLVFRKNSFLPVFDGKIEEVNDGCLVHIKARLHYFVSVFLVIWSLAFGALLFASGGDNLVVFLLAIAIILVTLIIVFFIPARRTINKIKSLLE